MNDPGGLAEIADSSLYRITRRIASGGMGAVYEARQLGVEGFEKTVAVKTIVRGYADDPEVRRLFIGEAKLVADLVHENIVQVYHLGATEGRYYLVMEYVDGVNLAQFTRRHKELDLLPPVELGAFIISRICRGLEYAHAKRGHDGHELGIVHRDVSPKNVLINFEGVVKMADFGIAKARRHMEQKDDVMMGKFEYMSPEQTRGEITDRRSDLFSLGIVMYELLLGRPLFQAPTPRHVIEKVQRLPIPSPGEVREDLPPALASIVMRALERDPSRRFGTAGEMGHALEHYMYHDRFGPTNVTLGEYMKEHFRPEQDGA